MRLRLQIILILFFLAIPMRGQRCIPVRGMDDLPYDAGEKLTYTLHYRWGVINADVGSATLSVDTVQFCGQKMFYARAFGQSVKMVEMFFKLREEFQSWFTWSSLQPVMNIRDSHEGSYYAYDIFRYDADEGVIHAELSNKRHGKRTMQHRLHDCTYDLPSILYFARNMDISGLQEQQRYPLSFAIDDGIFDITLTFLGREQIAVKGIGPVRALKFSCSLVQGQTFSGDTDALMWFSDDDNRILLYFECEIWKGLVQGRLARYQGLKHTFTSLQR